MESAKTLKVWQGKYRVKYADGTIRFLYGNSVPQLESDGSVLWHGYISDITEQTLAEKKIQQIDQQYRDMFEKNTAVKLVVNPENGAIITANLSAEKFYGYSIAQLETMSIDQINILNTSEIDAKMNIAAQGNSKCFNFQHRLASGEIRDVEVYSGPFELDGKLALNSIIHDITERKRAEQELINTSQRLENIVEGAHVGTWEWNVQTGETIFNEVWAQLFGYTLEELAPVSIKTWEKMAHPDDLKESDRLLNKHFLGELPLYEFECRVKHKDGHWMWILDRGRAIKRSEDGTPLMMFGTHTDITERKLAEAALNNYQEELKKFASHLQHIHDEERILLARKIHDELAQTLIAMKIDMGLLKNSMLKKSENVNINEVLIKFDQLFDLVNNTIQTTSGIMTGLRPEALYLLGLVEAIPLYINLFETKYGIKCWFENSLSKIEINTLQSVALFRILQEALENVALHAKATMVEIDLSTEMNKIVLKIADNGIGFDEKMLVKSDTYGFIGMKERALFVNGEFSITGILGKGTTIMVQIPLTKV
jgi:PAS domain S-box-containing protein